MRKLLKYNSGWNGGGYSLDDEPWYPEKDDFVLYINGVRYPHIVGVLYGEDDDHGHSTLWNRYQILVGLDTNLPDYTAYVPVETIMDEGDWDDEDMDDLFTINRKFTVEIKHAQRSE